MSLRSKGDVLVLTGPVVDRSRFNALPPNGPMLRLYNATRAPLTVDLP